MNMASLNLNENTKKAVVRKIQKACCARWLSLGKAVMSLYQDYPAVLITLIPILDTVSKTFQKGTITFSHIAPNLAYVKMKLQEEAFYKAITDAVKDLKLNGHLTLQGVEVQVTQQGMVEVDNLLHKYVDALVQHLDERFRNTLPLFSQLTVLDPVLLPSPDSVAFLEYGKDEIQETGKIYAPEKSSRGSCEV